ncbi:STAS domain-containing protein [Streptomyces mirabilis]|uniref:STAS domain-containing protein n=1 Tax=Streptomyces mirabilis TaxID=68239 RepID=UPI00352F1D09
MGDDGCGIAADEALGRLTSQPLTNRPALSSQPATLRAPRGNGVLPGSPSVSPASAVEEVVTDTHEAAQPGLSFGHQADDDIRVVVLRGEIDHNNRASLKEAALRPEGAPTPRTVADFRGVTFMDSSGINVSSPPTGPSNRLRLAGVRESVQRVLRTVDIDAPIPCHSTAEEALTS